MQINGEQTQGENIADNGGLHESFRAYLDSVEANGEEPRLPGLDQYSPEQTFFISYAQVRAKTWSPANNGPLTSPN